MLRAYSHHRLIDNGAPALPHGYFYLPQVVFVGYTPLLRMEVRKRRWMKSDEVSSYTVDPNTYFTSEDSDEMIKRVNTLCENAIMAGPLKDFYLSRKRDVNE